MAEKKMEKVTKSVTGKEIGGSADRFWNPRFWDGMTLSAWTKALWSGSFRMAPSRVAMSGLIYGLGVVNSSFALASHIFRGGRVRRTQLVEDPIFVIGHWRSGTTLLHEYMIRDERFTFSDTYTCFAPSHFLVSGPFFRPWVACLMPKARPMDNMAAGLDRPQEDEFALCAFGLPSPYREILFPNAGRIDEDYLTLRNISDSARKKWLDTFEYFLKELTVANNKTIILKSPPHTARIKAILERFPNARFVHIHRDPYTLFPSTCTLWMKLAAVHGVQHPKGKGLEEKVYSDFEHMYNAFAADLPLLKEHQLVEVGYTDLVRNPVETLEKIYSGLNLTDFESVRATFANYAESQRSYKKNKFRISPETVDTISNRWKWYLTRYGYSAPALSELE
ncbi:MAG: sulfotransferase [Planctomycetia bacterium]|nr:sulfotransferase [Planctomycetia bacterium]